MLKKLIFELMLRVQNLKERRECKNKEEIQTCRELSPRGNESKHSGEYVGKGKMLQIIQMSEGNPNEKHKGIAMLENHIKTRRGKYLVYLSIYGIRYNVFILVGKGRVL